MEADGWLVEHAAEIGAQVRGESDALAFAGGEGGDAASQLQVAEADRAQELKAFANFREDVAGDDRGQSGQPGSGENVASLFNRELGKIVDGRSGVAPARVAAWRAQRAPQV